jgi:hypothetical protein
MKRLLIAVTALLTGASLMVGCSESRSDRLGERPGDRPPSASPPTATPPPATSTPEPAQPPASSPSTSSPSSTPSSPGSGTK